MDKYMSKLAQHRVLETERLILRPVSLKDATDLFEYASNEKNTYFVFNAHKSIQETEMVITNGFMKKPLGEYGLELKESGKMVGTVSLRLNDGRHNAEIGYTLSHHYQKQGLMTEAVRKLLDLAFNIIGLERVFGLCDSRNENSKKLLKRIDMIYEGTFRHDRKWKEGEWVDTVCYAILKEDYQNKMRSKVENRW